MPTPVGESGSLEGDVTAGIGNLLSRFIICHCGSKKESCHLISTSNLDCRLTMVYNRGETVEYSKQEVATALSHKFYARQLLSSTLKLV